MPLIARATDRGYVVLSGACEIGGISHPDTGPVAHWNWSVSRATASGSADSVPMAKEQIAGAWRAWLARAQLVETTEPAKVSPQSLRVVLARDLGMEMAWPDDNHVAMSGDVVVGVIASDVFRHMDPRIIRPPARAWKWSLHHDYALEGKCCHGGADSKAAACEATTASWRRWLGFAGLGPQASFRP